jgi:hypothetical protein
LLGVVALPCKTFEVLSRDGTVVTIPNSGASREMNNNVWLETLEDGM